jgi:hypothetical protein
MPRPNDWVWKRASIRAVGIIYQDKVECPLWPPIVEPAGEGIITGDAVPWETQSRR